MTTTQDSVVQQNAAISEALALVLKTTENYQKISAENATLTGIEVSGKVSAAHNNLVLSTMKFLSTIRGPLDSVWSHFENAAHTGAVRALLEMGVVDALAADGSGMTSQELAKKLNVEENLLIRLMRCATILGPFKEIRPQTYANTPYSLMYQVPAIQDVMKLMVDDYGPPLMQLSMFFKENGWREPILQNNNPYTFAHHTNGVSMWEYMGKYPDRVKAFNGAMLAQTQATSWTAGIFPFQKELSKVETNDETVLVVDIGGGKGHITEKIRGFVKDIKGRVILQDLPSVIDSITAPLTGVEKMGYDFFTQQPIKGARLYYIRRCLHDWPDLECVTILSNIAAAMDPAVSRILISEIIVPTMAADLETGWMDLTTMTLTGCERTLKQWEGLLDDAGLKLTTTHEALGSNYSVIEAVLK